MARRAGMRERGYDKKEERICIIRRSEYKSRFTGTARMEEQQVFN